MHWLARTELVIHEENLNKLSNSKVMILGCGGVGGFAAEAVARSGIGEIIILDKDTIDVTNINRQIIATTKTIGEDKVKILKERILEINPGCRVVDLKENINKENISNLIPDDVDYVIDAIDTITSKIAVAVYCEKKNIKLISSMGTGNKMNPMDFQVTDIYKTSVCPLAKVIRKELKERGVKKLKVVYSKEKPAKTNPNDEMLKASGKRQIPGSISFVPSVAGLILASEVVKGIIEYKG